MPRDWVSSVSSRRFIITSRYLARAGGTRGIRPAGRPAHCHPATCLAAWRWPGRSESARARMCVCRVCVHARMSEIAYEDVGFGRDEGGSEGESEGRASEGAREGARAGGWLGRGEDVKENK